MYVCVRVCVYEREVCVCVCERERERVCVSVRESVSFNHRTIVPFGFF